MLAETRRRLLLERISGQGFATLDELVRALGVSESTVRRDLEALDLAGAIKRTHGGAVFLGEVRSMPALEDRATTETAEKRAIGRRTAALVDDGDTVLLDGGTTTLEVARALLGRPVQVVTNSLPIAQLLATSKDTDLILIGGYIYPRTGVALGPLAIAMMQGIRVRKAILGAGGIMPDGVYNSNLLLVETERQMMKCGQEHVLVADHSKFGRQALTWLCGLDAFGHLVVDPGIAPEHRAMVEGAGVAIHDAPLDPEPAEPQRNGTTRPTAPTTRPEP